jgi:hypothetical protein
MVNRAGPHAGRLPKARRRPIGPLDHCRGYAYKGGQARHRHGNLYKAEKYNGHHNPFCNMITPVIVNKVWRIREVVKSIARMEQRVRFTIFLDHASHIALYFGIGTDTI